MSMSGESGQRVGNAEREAAIEALNQHWQAGRLDPAEHERRTTAAYAAVTRGDLDALFADLPGGDPATARAQDARPAPLQGEVVQTPSSSGIEPQSGSGLFPADSWIAQHRDALMGVMPFVALALFFLFKSWVWFLLIPAAGVVLYSGGDRRKRGRDRDE
ncbi:MAG: DUF1707 domain-containing protein [Lapillicoccus sp.]